MWGQWIQVGIVDGTRPAFTAVLNIDFDRQSVGRLHVKETAREGRAIVEIINTDLGAEWPVTLEYANPPLSGVSLPARATLVLRDRDDNALTLDYFSEWAGNGTLVLVNQENRPAPPAIQTIATWSQFREWCTAAADHKRRCIFRGQAEAWPMTTSFHRTGRRDLIRYHEEDVPSLQRAVVAASGHYLKTEDAIELGSLLYLAQHHGFPTPLLDWTESPYIAAFFALGGNERAFSESADVPARILMFDLALWNSGTYSPRAASPEPYFHVHSFLPIGNVRALPQQSVVTSTNVSSPEMWLQNSPGLLTAIDLHRSMRFDALHELRVMGITSASLFPGLEGACQALRQRNFHA